MAIRRPSIAIALASRPRHSPEPRWRPERRADGRGLQGEERAVTECSKASEEAAPEAGYVFVRIEAEAPFTLID
jgi:hypothetical protein